MHRNDGVGPRIALGVAAIWLTAGVVMAQESPYAQMTDREVKALSAAQISDYLEGRGMGFALAAELNGFPGPKHVLELRQELGLSIHQRDETQKIFDAMRSRAVELGRQVVERERELDALFAAREIDPARLERLTEEIGLLNGRLRGVHLQAHLETVEILDEHQRRKYGMLRGYGHGGNAAHHGEHR